MVAIVQKGDPVLRKKAKEIPLKEITSTKIKKIIKQMRAGIDTRDDAVAIAAPQLGHSLRMFMVSHKVFLVEEDVPPENTKDMIVINPVITKKSRKKVEADEGCLSVDQWYGKTKRADKVVIRGYDERGKRFERGASGLLAQIFQHEIDHLNGILFTDHATDLVKLPSDKKQRKIAKKKRAKTKRA